MIMKAFSLCQTGSAKDGERDSDTKKACKPQAIIDFCGRGGPSERRCQDLSSGLSFLDPSSLKTCLKHWLAPGHHSMQDAMARGTQMPHSGHLALVSPVKSSTSPPHLGQLTIVMATSLPGQLAGIPYSFFRHSKKSNINCIPGPERAKPRKSIYSRIK